MAITTTDWRTSIRANNRKTFIVISIFFLIYFFLGLLIDVFVYAEQYPQANLRDIFYALMTLQLFPLVTLIMSSIAAISLFITLTLNNKLMLLGTEYKEITPSTAMSLGEKQLYNIIEELKIAAGLRYMPRVYIIQANYMNAFASGFSEKSAMVAITSGLLQKLNRSELQAVMAHEISHIRHMDIKLTLIASLLANLIIIVLDFFFRGVLYSKNSSNKRSGGLIIIIVVLRFLLPLINILLLLYLSRTREYMADAGSVELLRDNQPLASALIKINKDYSDNKDAYAQTMVKTPNENVRREAYIFDPVRAGAVPSSSVTDFFSTHPSLEKRLHALGFKYHDPK